jgi:hypothetical protein
MTPKKRQRPRSLKSQPDAGEKLGIFWLVGKDLVIAETPLEECELYSDVMNEPRSHVDYWASLQEKGTVPREMEYEESPRGRTVYNTKTKQFTLMADKHILADSKVVKAIIRELHLPKGTNLDGDYHYRCSVCLYGSDDDDE